MRKETSQSGFVNTDHISMMGVGAALFLAAAPFGFSRVVDGQVLLGVVILAFGGLLSGTCLFHGLAVIHSQDGWGGVLAALIGFAFSCVLILFLVSQATSCFTDEVGDPLPRDDSAGIQTPAIEGTPWFVYLDSALGTLQGTPAHRAGAREVSSGGSLGKVR